MLAVIAVFALCCTTTCAFAGVLAWQDIQATSAVVDARQRLNNGSLP